MVGILCLLIVVSPEILLDKVVAVVEGKAITLSEARDVARIYNLSITEAVNWLVDMEIIGLKAKEMGIEVEEKELDEEIRNMMSREGISPENFEEVIKSEGFKDLNDFKSHLRKRILRNKISTFLFQKEAWLNDEELKRFYLANPDKCVSEKKIEVYHIFVRGRDDDAYKKAEKFYTLIKNKKKEDRLSEVMKIAEKYSEAPSSEERGRIGWIGRGELVKEIDEIAFSLPPKEVSPPVAVKNGFHIIYVNDIKEKEKLPFEMCKEEIMKEYINERMEELLKQWIKKQKKKLGIELEELGRLKN
jgi:peptidyl-prolyl cis-trans isomerase C